MDKQKEQIIYWARRLNERGLISARSGNISLKTDKGILITAHDCYLGELSYEDILMVDSKGNVLEGKGEATSEKNLHLGIHRKFPHVKVVLHSHSPYTVAFFHYFGRLDIFSFEAKFYLGEIKVVPQEAHGAASYTDVVVEINYVLVYHPVTLREAPCRRGHI